MRVIKTYQSRFNNILNYLCLSFGRNDVFLWLHNMSLRDNSTDIASLAYIKGSESRAFAMSDHNS